MGRSAIRMPIQTPSPVRSEARVTWTSMAAALSVARRRRDTGLLASRPIEPASISPARAFEAETTATRITAAGAIIEYISPFRKPLGVAMSAPPKKLVSSLGMRAISWPMESCMGTNMGPSTRPRRPITAAHDDGRGQAVRDRLAEDAGEGQALPRAHLLER